MALKTKIVKNIMRFGKEEKHETRAVLLTYNDGPVMLDIRKYYKNKEGELTPAKGIAVPVDQLDDLRKAVVKATRWIEENDS